MRNLFFIFVLSQASLMVGIFTSNANAECEQRATLVNNIACTETHADGSTIKGTKQCIQLRGCGQPPSMYFDCSDCEVGAHIFNPGCPQYSSDEIIEAPASTTTELSR